MSEIRSDIVFTGRVQGVGFRYTTVAIARDYQVQGWVRNEADGSVRCVVEGEQAEVEAFLKAVQSRMEGYITDTSVQQGAVTGEYSGFAIRR